MAEEQEEGSSSGTGPQAGGAGADPAAFALGLASASRQKADAFLEKQTSILDDQRRLTALQIEKLETQDHFEQSHLRWRRFNDQMKGALQIIAVLIGLAVVSGLGVMVWNASQARGLVVESFAVPPKFAEAGITGAVLSDDINSKLGAISKLSDANSLTRSSEVSASRDDEFKVEIPDTGVSLGQAWRILRLWLGHERRLTGNLRELPDGRIALNVTLVGADAFTDTGPAADLDKLEQQAAEHVYQQVDPTNYGQYLGTVNRRDEMLAAAQRGTELAKTDKDRANAFGYLSSVTIAKGDLAQAMAQDQISINYDPKVMPAYTQKAGILLFLGQNEEALRNLAVVPTLREEDQPQYMQGRPFRTLRWRAAMIRALETGNFAAAASLECVECTTLSQKLRQAEYASRAHDMPQSRLRREEVTALLRATGTAPPGNVLGPANSNLDRIGYYQHAELGLWREAAADARVIAAAFDARNLKNGPVPVSHSWTYPLLVVAEARSGDLARAHSDADAMPTDCYPCLSAHGVIAGIERNWAGADWWFARAVKAAPSIPFAYHEWGQSLLERGMPDEAIAQFTLANKKGPHFADPLEGWGEALMAKNQSHLALAKFKEAEKYAPNWGRLHLKWGEALVYAGNKDEAKVQFARAAQLDLTPSEKAELARMH